MIVDDLLLVNKKKKKTVNYSKIILCAESGNINLEPSVIDTINVQVNT